MRATVPTCDSKVATATGNAAALEAEIASLQQKILDAVRLQSQVDICD